MSSDNDDSDEKSNRDINQNEDQVLLMNTENRVDVNEATASEKSKESSEGEKENGKEIDSEEENGRNSENEEENPKDSDSDKESDSSKESANEDGNGEKKIRVINVVM